MEKQRRRDTDPETVIRSRLHRLGYRFRVDVRPEPDLRVRGDIVWKGRKLVVFIDGCFWHACPQHGTLPKRNSEWWRVKLQGNATRDARYTEELEARGWKVLRFWEHEDPDVIVQRIVAALLTDTN